VVEEQDQFVEAHHHAIGHHKKLLSREQEMIQKLEEGGEIENDVDCYVEGLELILKKRRELDDILLR